MSQFPKAKPSMGPRRERGPRTVRTHAIQGGTTDWDGISVCADCGFRADHRVHAVEVSDEASEIDARRLGEAPDG